MFTQTRTLPLRPMRLILRLLPALLLLAMAGRASAVIERLMPLANIIADSDTIYMARVDKLDVTRQAMVLAVEQVIKGKAEQQRFTVPLASSDVKQTQEMLQRLAENQQIMIFSTDLGGRVLALGFTRGTWFQLTAQGDAAARRWSFMHIEPYLRRAWKDEQTDKLRDVVAGVIGGTVKPPEPDPKEAPGMGPVVEASGASPSAAAPEQANPLIKNAMWIFIGVLTISAIFLAFAIRRLDRKRATFRQKLEMRRNERG